MTQERGSTSARRAAQARPNTGPLAGIRILDLTTVVFGPYATQILGDMGADIVKVEGPEGDITRHIEPMRSPGMGGTFLNANRNKRSLVLDLKQPHAREALKRVTATADVLVHNMRPQAIRKLGLGYQAMKSAKPDLIYVNAWGFGREGPYAERPAYDDIIQAMSGMADLAHRQTGGPPMLAPTIFADKTSGLALSSAILLALVHKLRSGEGQEVEVPMFETVASNVLLEHLSGAAFVPPLPDDKRALGYARVLAPHRKPYRTKDGYMGVTPYTDKHWRGFFAAAGRPELADDPLFATIGARSRNIAALYAMVAELMEERTTAEWLALLAEADLPHVAVKSLEDLLADEHLAAVGFFQEYEHPSEGRVRTTKVPLALSGSPGDALRRPAPRLGQHSREILAEAGLGEGEIAHLISTGATLDAGC